MGWGGARVGAGKKPKRKPETAVSPFAVFAGKKTDPPSMVTDSPLAEPPADLPAVEQSFWRIYAPLAIGQGTLIPAHVGSFRLLCELHAKKAIVGAMVDKGALGGLRVFMQLSKQVEGLMARFCLAPFGKPVKSEKPKKAENPFMVALGK
jgi:hypothetical protein